MFTIKNRFDATDKIKYNAKQNTICNFLQAEKISINFLGRVHCSQSFMQAVLKFHSKLHSMTDNFQRVLKKKLTSFSLKYQ